MFDNLIEDGNENEETSGSVMVESMLSIGNQMQLHGLR